MSQDINYCPVCGSDDIEEMSETITVRDYTGSPEITETKYECNNCSRRVTHKS